MPSLKRKSGDLPELSQSLEPQDEPKRTSDDEEEEERLTAFLNAPWFLEQQAELARTRIPIWSSDDEEEEEDKPEFQNYYNTLIQGYPFYAPDKPPGLKISCNRPNPVYDTELLTKFATFALDWYSQQQSQPKYKLKEVLYASLWNVFCYCITFTALHPDTGCEETFRAMVHDFVGHDLDVSFFDKFDPKLHPAAWLESRKATKG